MKKSKIILALLIVAVMVSSLFALIACNEKPQPEVELVMWAPAGAQTFYQTWADKWAEEYSKSEAAQGKTYKVIMGIMGEKDAATNLIQMEGDGPDLLCFANDQIDDLLAANLLSPLGNPDNENATLAKDIAARNTEGSVATARGKDGNLYAFPMQADNTFYLFYDSSVLTKEDVRTWDSLFAAVDDYNAANNKEYGVQIDLGDPWYQSSFFLTFNGQVNSTQSNFGSDEVGLKALKAVHQFALHSTLKVVASNDLGTEFKKSSQKIVAGVGGSFVYSEVMANNPDVKVAVLPKIVFEQQEYTMIPFLGSKLIGINAMAGERIPAARSLANYLTGEEVQLDKMVKLAAGPSNINAANSDQATQSELTKVLADQALYSVAQSNLPGGYWEAIKTPVNAVRTGVTSKKYKYYKDGAYDDVALRELLTNMMSAIKFEK